VTALVEDALRDTFFCGEQLRILPEFCHHPAKCHDVSFSASQWERLTRPISGGRQNRVVPGGVGCQHNEETREEDLAGLRVHI